jgi:hypothetical protein
MPFPLFRSRTVKARKYKPGFVFVEKEEVYESQGVR